MSKISVMSFRVNVPNATPAAAPLSLDLEAMSPALQRFTIFSTASVDITKAGFRLRCGNTLLVPDNGSNESITLAAANEAGWAGLVNSALDLIFGGHILSGPPYKLTVDFYNTTGAAIVVGGFVHTCMPEATLGDLIKEIKRAQENIIPVRYDPRVKETIVSDNPPYPVQQVKT